MLKLRSVNSLATKEKKKSLVITLNCVVVLFRVFAQRLGCMLSEKGEFTSPRRTLRWPWQRFASRFFKLFQTTEGWDDFVLRSNCLLKLRPVLVTR